MAQQEEHEQDSGNHDSSSLASRERTGKDGGLKKFRELLVWTDELY
jgi:hypothetical protein